MKKQILLTGAAVVFSAAISLAQWGTKGPYGGAAFCLKSKNNKVFAGTINGVFKSSDDGKNWTACNKGIEKVNISCMNTTSSEIFAGSETQGVYCSTDDGQTWTSKNNGLGGFNIKSMFKCNAGLFVGTNNGVHCSTNAAATWSLMNSGIAAGFPVYCWAEMGDTVYAGTYGKGLYMKNSTSATWSVVLAGFPQGTSVAGTFVYALHVSGNKIVAGTSAGIYISNDRGVSWAASNTGMPLSKWARCFTSKGTKIYCGTYNEGIFVSANGGASWTSCNNGMFNWGESDNDFLDINELEVCGSALVCASYNGLNRTEDDGDNWNDCNEGSLATDVRAVACSGNTIYAGTEYTGVYRSNDNGVSWKRCNKGLKSNNIRSTCMKGKKVYAACVGKKVYKSDDDGENWSSCSNGLSNDIKVLKCDGDNIYAITEVGASVNQKLYCSKNEGSNWTEVGGAAVISGVMNAMCAAKGKIYIGTTNGGLYCSKDDGENWDDISVYLPSVQINCILDLDSIVIVGTQGKGCYKFMYNGTHMIAASLGLTNLNVTDLHYQNGIVLASTFGGGIFASINFCNKWSNVSGNLGNKYLACLGASSTKVFLGSSAAIYQTEEGAFDLLKVLMGTKEFSGGMNVSVYPNPSNGVIHLDGINASEAQLFDYTGKLILQVENPGTVINLNTMQKGAYFLKLSTANGSQTQKVILQ